MISVRYILSFRDVTDCEKVYATLDGKRIPVEKNISAGTVSVNVSITPGSRFRIIMKNITVKKNPPRKEMITDLLSKVQGSNNAKMVMFSSCLKESFKDNILFDNAIRYSIKEIKYISE